MYMYAKVMYSICDEKNVRPLTYSKFYNILSNCVTAPTPKLFTYKTQLYFIYIIYLPCRKSIHLYIICIYLYIK